MKTFRNLLLEMAAKKTKKSESVVASVVPVPSEDQGEGVQRHYEHAGDVHFNDGEEGAKTMADTFSSIIDSAPEHLATKIDGSPSMEYGIEGGRHYLSYKGSKKKSTKMESIVNNMLSYIFEEGEASSGQMTSDGSGIAGLGDDARAGNVIVRKRPRMFKRRKR